MTLVQFCHFTNGLVMLVKMHADRDPIIVPIGVVSQKSFVMEMTELLKENDESGEIGKVNKDPRAFWNQRRKIDMRLKVRFSLFFEVFKNLLLKIEEKFLGSFSALLHPSLTLSVRERHLAEKLVRITAVANGHQLTLSFAKVVNMKCSTWKQLGASRITSTVGRVNVEGPRPPFMRIVWHRGGANWCPGLVVCLLAKRAQELLAEASSVLLLCCASGKLRHF